MSEEKQEPQYLQIQFETDKGKYEYDFNKLTAAQVFSGIKYFKLELGMDENLPNTPSEVEIITQRQVQRWAFASILNKFKSGSDEIMPFSEARPPAFDFLDEVKGAENFRNLMEIRQNFFSHTGLYNLELTKGLGDLMKQLNGLSEIEKAQVFKLMNSTNISDSMTKKGRNSTQKSTSEKK